MAIYSNVRARCLSLILGGITSMLVGASASAQTIVYSFSAIGSGTYDGSGFSGKNILLRFTANLEDVITVSPTFHVAGILPVFGATHALVEQTLAVQDIGSFNLTFGSVYVFTNNKFSGYGLATDHLGGSITMYYDMLSDLLPITVGTGSGSINQTYSVTGGTASTIFLGGYTGMTFSAAASVPEPETFCWLAGAAALGASLLKRRLRGNSTGSGR